MALPATEKIARVGLAAMRAEFVGLQGRIQTDYHFRGAHFLRHVVYPHFRTGLRIGQVTHRADRIGIQNMVGDAHTCQRIGDQLRFDEAAGAKYPLHRAGWVGSRLISLPTDAHNQVNAFRHHALRQRLHASNLHVLGIDIGELAAVDFV